MPQRDLLLPWLSALDNAALALRIAGHPRAAGARTRRQACSPSWASRASSRLIRTSSRGACASAWRSCARCSSGKPVLCLDEPFGALDAITRAEMQEWLAGRWQREPRTVVLVTHDVEEAVLLADRVVVLSSRPGHVVAELEIELAPTARAHRPGGDRRCASRH